MRLCVQTAPIIDRFGADNGFRMIKEAGFDSVDYNIDHMLGYGDILEGKSNPLFDGYDASGVLEYIKPVKEAAKKYGIAINQMHAPFPSYVKNDAGNELVMKSIKYSIIAAGELECKYLIVHPMFLGYDDQLSPKDEWNVNIERYSELIPYAKKYGVVICLENMFSGHRGKLYAACCADMSEANRYIDYLNEKTGDKLFGFCLDVGHALLVGKEIYSTIMEIAPNLVALHVHDNDGRDDQHLYPYFGRLDWERFCAGLRDAGYRNALSFETFNGAQIMPDELVLDGLKFCAAAGRYFISKIEG